MRNEEDEEMSKRPFFSVIIPAHDSEEFIRKGLDSIKSQDFEDYELIIVCDACTDHTEDVAEEYADRVIVTNYGAAGMARNAGLDVATGEWILFMDDDDWYMQEAFRKIAEAIAGQPGIDILAFGFEWKGVRTAYQSPARVYPAVWSKAWRRDFIGNERFPYWVHTDDLGFAWRMHPMATFGYWYEALYYYNFLRAGSVSERIRNGEYDNNQLPEQVRQQAVNYENWLKSREF